MAEGTAQADLLAAPTQMLITYEIVLSGFRATDLPAMDVDLLGRPTSSDPYLTIDFDGFTFSTETISKNLNPSWVFHQKFEYQVADNADLQTKKMIIRSYNKDILRDDFIGERDITMDRILYGPKNHTLALYDTDGKPRGTIMFRASAKARSNITMRVNNITCVLREEFSDVSSVAKVAISECPQFVNSLDSLTGTNLTWGHIGSLQHFTCLEDLLNSQLIVTLIQGAEGTILGEVEFQIGSFFNFEGPNSVVKGMLKSGIILVGTINISVSFEGIMRVCQMPQGENTEQGIVGGASYHPSLPASL